LKTIFSFHGHACCFIVGRASVEALARAVFEQSGSEIEAVMLSVSETVEGSATMSHSDPWFKQRGEDLRHAGRDLIFLSLIGVSFQMNQNPQGQLISG
jgi:hypothetical protein